LDLFTINSIWKVQEEGGSGCGEAVFLRGETWNGELKRGLPEGSGSFFLPCGSVFTGELDSAGGFDGTFTHFSGTKVRGKWKNWALIEGALTFEDGDRVEGSWERTGHACLLKSGRLTHADERRDIALTDGLKSKGKTFYKNYESQGFAVVWDAFAHPNHPSVAKLALAMNGWYSYEKREDGLLSRHSLALKALVACEHIQKQERSGKWSDIFVTPFGFALRPLLANNCVCTFRLNDDLLFKGVYVLSEFKIKIKGKLFCKVSAAEQLLGTLCIKKRSESDLVILFNEQTFDSLKEFYAHICRADAPVTTAPKAARNPDSLADKHTSKKALGSIVGGIKHENQCQIF